MSRAGWVMAGVMGLVAVGLWQRDAVLGRLQAAGLVPAGAVPAAAAPLRKCIGADARVVYTNGRCPSGHREAPVDGGSLSVLPATRPAAAAASAAASAVPLLRRLAPDADGPTIRERMADRLP